MTRALTGAERDMLTTAAVEGARFILMLAALAPWALIIIGVAS